MRTSISLLRYDVTRQTHHTLPRETFTFCEEIGVFGLRLHGERCPGDVVVAVL